MSKIHTINVVHVQPIVLCSAQRPNNHAPGTLQPTPLEFDEEILNHFFTRLEHDHLSQTEEKAKSNFEYKVLINTTSTRTSICICICICIENRMYNLGDHFTP